jgi:hypothetical protein
MIIISVRSKFNNNLILGILRNMKNYENIILYFYIHSEIQGNHAKF